MGDLEIPQYFLCPISLQMMRDPVTLPTGITFDRGSIERWLAGKSTTCPVTKQPLPTSDICTPNHTLRRLIQAWCVANPSSGVDRIPTPRVPVDRSHISKLLQEAPADRLTALRKLHEIAACSEANRRCVENSDAVEFLVAIVEENVQTRACDEALAILHSLQISERRLLGLVTSRPGFVDSLFNVFRHSNYKPRAHAAVLLKSAIALVSPVELAGFGEDRIHEIVEIVRDRLSTPATKAALQVLIELFSWGKNRVKAVNAGAVYAVLDLLLEVNAEKRLTELALVALDKLCACAEGRAELVGHAAGIAVVSKKILRVSAAGSERAVRIVEKVARMSATPAVLQEMLQVGVVSKLCLVLQVEESGAREKERAREVLRLHARVWRRSSCLSSHHLFSYPSL